MVLSEGPVHLREEDTYFLAPLRADLGTSTSLRDTFGTAFRMEQKTKTWLESKDPSKGQHDNTETRAEVADGVLLLIVLIEK